MIDWLSNGGIPYLAVIMLGVVVSVCPCTIAANLSALTCMLRKRNDSFAISVGSYLLARMIAYVVVGELFVYCIRQVEITASAFAWIGKMAGPLFVVIGVFLLDIFHIHGFENRCVIWMNRLFDGIYSPKRSFLLGLLLAFAFCPYSAGIYFGMMVPMAYKAEYGFFIPILFAVGSVLPLIFVAWVMYKGLDANRGVWTKFQNFEYWFRKILAVIFIVTGFLFIWEYFLE